MLPHLMLFKFMSDLNGHQPVAADDDVVGVVVDGDGAEAVDGGVDVVLVDALLPGLAQHAQGLVEAVDHDVALASQLPPQQAWGVEEEQEKSTSF